ncbi:MAG TPA: hypothetical protein V6C57_19245 [Coleofasciculaceae cyanobacterium]
MRPFSESLFQGAFNFSELDEGVKSTIRLANQSPLTLYLFFHRYTYFNGYASTLISRLASSIGLSRYLFADPHEPVMEAADRGMQIATHVLAAAADEGANGGVCHRSLAQLTLQTAGDYARLTTEQRNQFAQVPTWLEQIVQSLVIHYQGTPGDRASLVQALGFHAASELLGDRENAVIDQVIRFEGKASGFNRYMNEPVRQQMIQGHRYHPWAYILIHGQHEGAGVEAEHFEDALNALNLCAQYQPHLSDQIQTWALEGFSTFVKLQQRLFFEMRQESSIWLQPAATLH